MALTSYSKPGLRSLFAPDALIYVWGPLVAIASLHYATPPDPHWVHDFARRLYYVPIVFAGSRGGLLGGLVMAVVVTLSYLPHAFFGHDFHDPAAGSEKLLELIFYFILGATSGLIAERSATEKQRLAAMTLDLRSTLDDLESREAELRRAARLDSLGAMTAGLAHEIRNPLHAMRGTAEILLDVIPTGSPEERMGERHLAEIDRLSQFLQRFLSFAKGQPTERGPVSLREVNEQVVGLLRAQAGQQQTNLRLIDAPDALAEVDRDQLVQVCLGVGINALQAIGTGGTVCFSVVQREDRVGLMVENTGPPIAEELLGPIFDPFVSTRSEGTGLGLSVAWRIIEANEGFLEVKNTKKGVAFWVWLHLAR